MSAARVIIGLTAVVGGGLTLWRGVHEYAEFKAFGPPAWWVMWRHPLAGKALPPPKEEALARDHATRVFRWSKDRWEPITKFEYDVLENPNKLLGGSPTDRSLVGQVHWVAHRRGDYAAWRMKSAAYARDAKV